VLDDLALTISNLEKAIALEPADWTLRHHAGVAALNLLLATGYTQGWASSVIYADLPGGLTGLQDWSGLANVRQDVPGPGLASESLAQDETTRAVAARYRSLDRDELSQVALAFLQAAKERNPLASQIATAIEIVEQVTRASGE
jgi:hypothetical protein